jgi:hypothetical protein
MKAFRRTMWIHYIRRILYIRWIAAVAILAAVVLGGTTACTLAGLRMGPRLQVTPPSINVWQAATPTPMPPAA